MVTKHHKRYSRDIGLTDAVESYIQTIVLKKTLESISYEYRREAELDDEAKAKPVGPSAGRSKRECRNPAQVKISR